MKIADLPRYTYRYGFRTIAAALEAIDDDLSSDVISAAESPSIQPYDTLTKSGETVRCYKITCLC